MSPGSSIVVRDPGPPLQPETYDANGNETSSSAGLSLGYNAKDQTSSLTPPGGSALAQSYTGATQIQRVTEASTSATLAYRYTHDLRAVQDMLGH